MQPRTTSFRGEFEWSRQWIPALRRFIGPHLLREATLEEDRTQATDLIVLATAGLRVACRVRHPGYAGKFGKEFTITCRRETGAACEFDKLILAGWADWFCYAHATTEGVTDGGKLQPAYLVDLRCARSWISRNHGRELGPNKDPVGSRCWFYAISIDALIAACGLDALVAVRWPLAA